jgi:uncharacterized RDD family membrane protein YckC
MASQPPSEPESRLPIAESVAVSEGMSLDAEPAPFWRRFFAYCIDLGVVSAVIYLILIVGLISMAGGLAAGGLLKKMSELDQPGALLLLSLVLLFLLVILCIYHGYFIYFELKTGQTPGKKLFGLKVVSTLPGRLTLNQCVMRDFFRYIDCGLVVPGLVSMAVTERRQRLGDLACSTLVVYSRSGEEREEHLYVKHEDYEKLRELTGPLPVPTEIRRQFLNVAYPMFILGRAPTHPEDLLPWEELARTYLPGAKSVPGGLDQTTVLLFFAEHCFQAHNEESPD